MNQSLAHRSAELQGSEEATLELQQKVARLFSPHFAVLPLADPCLEEQRWKPSSGPKWEQDGALSLPDQKPKQAMNTAKIALLAN